MPRQAGYCLLRRALFHEPHIAILPVIPGPIRDVFHIFQYSHEPGRNRPGPDSGGLRALLAVLPARTALDRKPSGARNADGVRDDLVDLSGLDRIAAAGIFAEVSGLLL